MGKKMIGYSKKPSPAQADIKRLSKKIGASGYSRQGLYEKSKKAAEKQPSQLSLVQSVKSIEKKEKEPPRTVVLKSKIARKKFTILGDVLKKELDGTRKSVIFDAADIEKRQNLAWTAGDAKRNDAGVIAITKERHLYIFTVKIEKKSFIIEKYNEVYYNRYMGKYEGLARSGLTEEIAKFEGRRYDFTIL